MITRACAFATGLLHRRPLLAMPSASAGGGRTGCCPVLPLQVLESTISIFAHTFCFGLPVPDLICVLITVAVACCKSSHPLISVWTLVAGVCVVVLQPQQRGQDQWCAEGPEDALTGQRCRFSWVVYSSEYTGLLYFAQLLTISDLGAISMQCSNMVLLFGCRCSRVLAPQAIHKD